MKRLLLALSCARALAACDGDTSGDDAGTSSGDAGSESYDCDPKHVTCRALPPECPPGFLPAVEGTCWDVCVPQLECASIACTEGGPEPQCPDGWGCVGTECRPPR